MKKTVLAALLVTVAAVVAGCKSSGGPSGPDVYTVTPPQYEATATRSRDWVQGKSGVPMSDLKYSFVVDSGGKGMGYYVNGWEVTVYKSGPAPGACGYHDGSKRSIHVMADSRGRILSGVCDHEWGHAAAKRLDGNAQHPASWRGWIFNWYDSDKDGRGN